MSQIDGPEHYNGYEVIELIEIFQLGFHLGNALKYILRAGKKTKNKIEDYEKALWYTERFKQANMAPSQIHAADAGTIKLFERTANNFQLTNNVKGALLNILAIGEQNLNVIIGCLRAEIEIIRRTDKSAID